MYGILGSLAKFLKIVETWRALHGVLYTKQILIVLAFMELNGFIIGSEIKKLFKIKVDTQTAGHPV